MKKTTLNAFLLALGILSSSVLFYGCDGHKDVGDSIEDAADDAGDAVKDAADEAGDMTREAADEVRDATN